MFRKAWHVSNPMNRRSILREGLIPSMGYCYEAHYDGSTPERLRVGLAIFLSLDKENIFDSTWDDDIYEISLPKYIIPKEDPSMKFPMAYTNMSIPVAYIKLIYKGTGKTK